MNLFAREVSLKDYDMSSPEKKEAVIAERRKEKKAEEYALVHSASISCIVFLFW